MRSPTTTAAWRWGTKPEIEDTQKLNVDAEKGFKLFINGELIAVDSIRFMPHNVISVDFFSTYPMTTAIMAEDNTNLVTAMEYNNTRIGDGRIILMNGCSVDA